jgi:hypothetical protein
MPGGIIVVKENLKILYVGPLMQDSTSLQRMRALQEIGHSFTSVNSAPNWSMKQMKPPLYYRIIGHPGLGCRIGQPPL